MTKLANQQTNTKDDLLLISSQVSNYIRVYNDFIYNVGDFQAFVSGTGTNIVYNTVDTSNHPGIATLNTGSTATGSARIGYGNTTGNACILFGTGEWKYESSVRIPILSNATNSFSTQAGFTDNPTPVDGVYFRYIHTENAGKWQACTRVNSNVINSIDTGILVNENQWYRLTILVNALGSSAQFFIDGVFVTSTILNIPTGTGRQTGIGINILKTLGSTGRDLNIDYIEVVGRLTTAR